MIINVYSKKGNIYTHKLDQVAEAYGPLWYGQQVRQAACQCVSEGHLEKGALRALWLVAAIGEDSLMCIGCIYYNHDSLIDWLTTATGPSSLFVRAG
jgi:hypothetical protein